MNNIKRYSYRHIWMVAYPILISLIMEQMIGMTDTAFLGRVGEVELGASAIAQQWPQDWKRSVFIPIPKKGNAKECSNYRTIALISC